jgi:hypothetical protein
VRGRDHRHGDLDRRPDPAPGRPGSPASASIPPMATSSAAPTSRCTGSLPCERRWHAGRWDSARPENADPTRGLSPWCATVRPLGDRRCLPGQRARRRTPGCTASSRMPGPSVHAPRNPAPSRIPQSPPSPETLVDANQARCGSLRQASDATSTKARINWQLRLLACGAAEGIGSGC